jgi:hypothetical protein
MLCSDKIHNFYKIPHSSEIHSVEIWHHVSERDHETKFLHTMKISLLLIPPIKLYIFRIYIFEKAFIKF